jgi:hypothetical protein
MPKYLPADRAVTELATSILIEFDSHAPTVAAGATERRRVGSCPLWLRIQASQRMTASRHQGQKALGFAPNRSLKPGKRSRSFAPTEEQIPVRSRNRWDAHDEEEQRALLDRELHRVADWRSRARRADGQCSSRAASNCDRT